MLEVDPSIMESSLIIVKVRPKKLVKQTYINYELHLFCCSPQKQEEEDPLLTAVRSGDVGAITQQMDNNLDYTIIHPQPGK